MRKMLLGAVMALGLMAQAWAPAGAQVPEIRLAKQFSMGYLQLNVMERDKLIEKHAKIFGIPDVKVSWLTFNGPAAVNEALLSDTIDIGSGGVPALLLLWSKTKGTPQEVRGITALSSQPFLLNARDPAIKSIKDFKETDKIAVPAIKVSVQAITLQMAAAKAFGAKDFTKLDTLTVSLSPPDATIALIGGKTEITAAFSVPPFQYQQLESPGIHTVLNSYEVMDGPHSFTVAWTTAKFRDKNPVLYKALVAALNEATDIVNKDKAAAGKLWIDDSRSKLAPDMVAKIVAGPQVKWTTTPEATMKYADFMTTVGSIKVKPASWKDFFFPEIYDLKGS